MVIYLDSCCYNRPYDTADQLTVVLEAQCKLYIQQLVKNGLITLVSSYMVRYESSQNPYAERRENIEAYIRQYSSVYVSDERKEEIEQTAADIVRTGVKFKDACHVASAIYAKCDYFITTDKRLLKYKSPQIKLVTPIEFVLLLEGE
jgi:hypothetical protein